MQQPGPRSRDPREQGPGLPGASVLGGGAVRRGDTALGGKANSLVHSLIRSLAQSLLGLSPSSGQASWASPPWAPPQGHPFPPLNPNQPQSCPIISTPIRPPLPPPLCLVPAPFPEGPGHCLSPRFRLFFSWLPGDPVTPPCSQLWPLPASSPVPGHPGPPVPQLLPTSTTALWTLAGRPEPSLP